MVTKQLWGEERVTFEQADGSLCSVPTNWTDVVATDPYLGLGGGRSRFRVEDLLALVALVAARTEGQ